MLRHLIRKREGQKIGEREGERKRDEIEIEVRERVPGRKETGRGKSEERERAGRDR